MKKIILVGYMGSGKSTIAKLLADKINFAFDDLDNFIEKQEKTSINSIFERKGELYFRKLEQQALKKVLNKKKNIVLSLGGGTPCYFNNHEVLNSENNISVYLKASIDTLLQRLKSSSNRPLLLNLSVNKRKEYIAKQLFERSFYYHQCMYSIAVDAKSPEEIVREIETLLL